MSVLSELRAGARSLPRWWPEEVFGLGARRCVQFARCAACPPGEHVSSSGTWVRFGDVPLCLRCARSLAAGVDVEFVRQAISRIRRFVDVVVPADSPAGAAVGHQTDVGR